MHHWTKRLLALAAPLLLTGCLWGPGKFASDLTLRKNVRPTLAQRGELVLRLPPASAKGTPWSDDMAACAVSDGNDMQKRACTKAEIASQKSDYEARAA